MLVDDQRQMKGQDVSQSGNPASAEMGQQPSRGATTTASTGDGSNVPTPTSAGDLPLVVVDRSQSEAGMSMSKRPSGLRLLRFVPLIMIIVAISGVAALYFQPPGLRFVMRTCGRSGWSR